MNKSVTHIFGMVQNCTYLKTPPIADNMMILIHALVGTRVHTSLIYLTYYNTKLFDSWIFYAIE